MLLAAIVTLLLIIIGIPVAYAFGFGALAAFASVGGDLTQIPSVAYRSIDSFPLLAIPFFLLAGEVMRSGGVSARLVHFVSLFVGRIRGGMGATLLGASAIFGAISGSSVATVSAMGSIMTPEMEKRGYPRSYVGGLTSVAGLLGILIPPSIPMVVYGIAANVSISSLFLGGLSAGLLLLVAMVVVNLLWARGRGDLRDRAGGAIGRGADKRLSAMALGQVGATVPALVMPGVILGGIYSGIFTPTEAGAVACLYGLVVGMLIYREMRPHQVPSVLARSALATAPILLIIALGGVFSRALTLSGVPQELTQWVATVDAAPWLILLGVNALLLAVGCFVEENTAIIILTPLLLPIVTPLGVDPVHFGVIMVLNLGIGLATPPMAPNVFVAARACAVDFHRVIGTTALYLLTAALPVLLVVNLVPALSTWGG